MKRLHIAFLTPELSPPSGLGHFVSRMVNALTALGHEVEVITTEPKGENENFSFPVYHLSTKEHLLGGRIGRTLHARSNRFRNWAAFRRLKSRASMAADFVEDHHRRESFDIVHSASYEVLGFMLPPELQARHIVRLSSHTILWRETDGRSIDSELHQLAKLEKTMARRARAVYAPSQWLAKYCTDAYGIEVDALPPPFVQNSFSHEIAMENMALPSRYFVHFGRIGKRKGSDFLAKTLKYVCELFPDFRMAWVGNEVIPGDLQRCIHMMGPIAASKCIFLPTISRDMLREIVMRADVTVLPSRVDNLPNTALESLAWGTPVVGTYDSSLDEIVDPDVNGALCRIDDVDELGRILVAAWQKEMTWAPSGLCKTPIFSSMVPEQAARNLLDLARSKGIC